LIRLVHIGDGIVEVDISARRPGRSAYLCPKKDCWEIGLKRNHLERALRTRLSTNSRQALIDYSNNLPGEGQV